MTAMLNIKYLRAYYGAYLERLVEIKRILSIPVRPVSRFCCDL